MAAAPAEFLGSSAGFGGIISAMKHVISSRLAILLIASVALLGWRWNGTRVLAGDGTPDSPAAEAKAFTNSLGMKFLHFPAGDARGDDNKAHAFEFTLKPVTQKQWTELMGENPSDVKGDDLSVQNVSENDAARFCWKLSQIEGRKYTLPTEEQWAWVQQAGGTALPTAMPRYTAVGWLVIGSMHPQNPLNTDATSPQSLEQLAIEQKNQVMLMHSDTVLSTALSNTNSQIRKTGWFKAFKTDMAAVQEDVRANFVVCEVPGTRLLKVEFSCSNAKDAKVILDEMVETHLDREKEWDYELLRDQTVELNNKRINLERQLRDDEEQLVDWRTRLNVDGGGFGRAGFLDIELHQCATELFALERKAVHAREASDALAAQIKAGRVPAALDQMVETTPSVLRMTGRLQTYEDAIQQATMAVGPDAAHLKKLQSLRDQFQKELDDKKAEIRAQGLVQIIDQARSDAESTTRDYKDMADKITLLKQSEGELSNDMNRFMILENQTRGLREELKAVQDRLDENNVKAIQNMQTKIQWSAKPEIPENASFPKLWIVLDAP
jgi:hypothetical protein